MHGRMRQYETPDWSPLEELLDSDELCAHFMWIHDVVLDDGTVLNAYKHRWTRCYFHLTADGRTLYYVNDHRYHEVDPFTAIKSVFDRWEGGRPTPAEKMALRAALRKAATAAEPK